jgi:hypothetical protein
MQVMTFDGMEETILRRIGSLCDDDEAQNVDQMKSQLFQ